MIDLITDAARTLIALVQSSTFALVVAIGIGLFVFRFITVSVLRWLGLFDPRSFTAFPRLPWRPIRTLWAHLSAWWEQNRRNGKAETGGWLSTLTLLTHQLYSDNLFFGRARAFSLPWIQPVGLDVETNIPIIAKAGAGKSVILSTMLALLPLNRSAIVIDPKGEFFTRHAPVMKRSGRPTHGVDFAGGKFGGAARWNIFDEAALLEAAYGESAVTQYFDAIALGVVERNPRATQAYFTDAARALFSSMLAYVYRFASIEDRNLAFVYRLLCFGITHLKIPREDGTPYPPHELLWRDMALKSQGHGLFGEYIARGAVDLMEPTRTTRDIISTLKTSLAFLAHDNVQRALKGESSFTFFEMKGGSKDAVFFLASAQDMAGPLAPVMRMALQSAAYIYETHNVTLRPATLLVADEFANIGHVPAMAKTGPLLRSAGLQLVLVAQDIPLLRAAYPDHADSMLGSSGATIWLATEEPKTLDYLSRLLGRATVKQKIKEGKHTRTLQQERPLGTEDQLRRMLAPSRGNIIVTRPGSRPMILRRADFHKGEVPVWTYEPDPGRREALGRMIGRALWRAWSSKYGVLAPQSAADAASASPASEPLRQRPLREEAA